MKKKQASTTAQGIAFIRASESAKPAGERICYDPLARRLISPVFYILGKLFLSYAEGKGPGVFGFLAARCRYMDDYLQECLKNDLRQLVILGAGLDSRAYRFEQLKRRVKVFEVDHPATQQAKIAKLKKILGDLPDYVTYVPVDFNEETLRKLFDFGYDPKLKTLFIWEGVTYYLDPDAVDETLKFVMNNSGPGSSIVFDYIYSSALTTEHKRGEVVRMQRTSKYTGEAILFGIEEGKIDEFLRKRGYSQIINMTSKDLKKTYFTGVNQSRNVAPVYAIVHATVKGN